MKDSLPPEIKGFPDQTIMAGEGSIGNCFQAALAGALSVGLDAVPHFALLGMHHWMHCAVAWLDVEHAIDVSTRPDDYPAATHHRMRHCIVRGQSPRGVGHACIGLADTGEIVHDPHPSRDGLAFINSRFYLFRRQAAQSEPVANPTPYQGANE